jgi:hypothetical protein
VFFCGSQLYAAASDQAASRDAQRSSGCTQPADKWGRCAAGRERTAWRHGVRPTGEELIQIKEDTYWSGGPYSTTVKGGAKALPEIRRLIFAGDLLAAHKLFGRHLLRRPVEQQKYQALGPISLAFDGGERPVRGHRHQLRRALDNSRAGL